MLAVKMARNDDEAAAGTTVWQSTSNKTIHTTDTSCWLYSLHHNKYILPGCVLRVGRTTLMLHDGMHPLSRSAQTYVHCQPGHQSTHSRKPTNNAADVVLAHHCQCMHRHRMEKIVPLLASLAPLHICVQLQCVRRCMRLEWGGTYVSHHASSHACTRMHASIISR
jgi:hypothetical protein